MKDWTRTPTDWADDPAVHAMAAELNVDAAQVIGHLLNVWSMLPAHARDGRLAHVPPTLLELWARWMGKKRGAFAAAFARHILDADGLWVLWEDLNGSVLREKDSDRVRAAQRRKAIKEEKERQFDLLLKSNGLSAGPSAGLSAGRSDATNGRYVPTAVTAGARARWNGNGTAPAFAPGHSNLPAPMFCEHCAGVVEPASGSGRLQQVHAPECPLRNVEAAS